MGVSGWVSSASLKLERTRVGWKQDAVAEGAYFSNAQSDENM